jgi:hypothetical protein
MTTKSVVSSPLSLGLDYLTPPSKSPSLKKSRADAINSETQKKPIPGTHNTVLMRLVFSYLKPGEETCLASRVCRSWRFCRYHLSSDELLVRATSVMHSLSLSKVRNYLLNYREKYPNLHAIHFNYDLLFLLLLVFLTWAFRLYNQGLKHQYAITMIHSLVRILQQNGIRKKNFYQCFSRQRDFLDRKI